jgi:hypothetical protein
MAVSHINIVGTAAQTITVSIISQKAVIFSTIVYQFVSGDINIKTSDTSILFLSKKIPSWIITI